MTAGWQQLGSTISPVELQDTRLYLQYALQWVERAALCASPELTDDNPQPLLTWRPAENGFFSQPFADGKRVGLLLEDGEATLSFGASNEKQTSLQTFALNGHTDAEARLWVREQIEDSATDTTEYNDPSSLPQHPLAEGARYKLSEHRESIGEIARWLSNAHLLLSALKQKDEHIHCSLEHFSIYLYKIGKDAKPGLNLGLSLGDLHYPQPYFYVLSEPPWQNAPSFSNELCSFHKKDFSGFVLVSEKVVHLQEQEKASAEFLQEASKLQPSKLD